MRRDVAVGDDQRMAARHQGGQRGAVVQQAGADADRVAALAEFDVHLAQLRPPAARCQRCLAAAPQGARRRRSPPGRRSRRPGRRSPAYSGPRSAARAASFSRRSPRPAAAACGRAPGVAIWCSTPTCRYTTKPRARRCRRLLGRQHRAAAGGDQLAAAAASVRRAAGFRAARKPASPSCSKISGTVAPVTSSRRWSASTKARPSRSARRRPIEVLPAPMGPMRTRLGAGFMGHDASIPAPIDGAARGPAFPSLCAGGRCRRCWRAPGGVAPTTAATTCWPCVAATCRTVPACATCVSTWPAAKVSRSCRVASRRWFSAPRPTSAASRRIGGSSLMACSACSTRWMHRACCSCRRRRCMARTPASGWTRRRHRGPRAFNGRVLLEAERRLAPLQGGSVLRLSGIYGPGRDAMLRRARAAAAPEARWSNRIHVDDAAAALSHLLDHAVLAAVLPRQR